MLNWPLALVIMTFLIGLFTTATSLFSIHVNRRKPNATHCIKCLKELKEEDWDNF